MKPPVTGLNSRCRSGRVPAVTAAAVPLCIGGIVAVFFLCGCTHQCPPPQPAPERMEHTLAGVVKASAEISGVDDIARRAVENAEARKIAATRQLAESAGNTAEEKAAVGEFLKKAEKEASEAQSMALELAVHTANVTNAVAAVRKLAEQAAVSGQSRAEKLAAKARELGDQCVREAATARKLSDDLKKKWLSLPAAPLRMLDDSSASNSIPGDRGR